MAQPKLRFKSEDGTSYPDWKSGIIGDYYTFKNGLNKDKTAFGKGTPIINYTDVFKNRLLTAKIIKGRVTLSEKEIENHSAQLGDVFFTRTSETLDEVGFCGALIEDIPNCVFSGFLLRGRPIDASLTAPDFAGYYFMTMPIRQEIISKSSITTRALTNGRNLSAVNINMPCLEEQQKIAGFLSTVDEVIAQSEAEVQNLEQQKKAAMQKIFSQEVRFRREDGTEFPEWEEKSISEICEPHARIGWQNLRTDEFLNEGDYYLVTGTDFQNGKVNFKTCHYIDKERYEQDKNIQIKNGSILITKDGTLGKVALVDNLDKVGTLNAGVFVLQKIRECIYNIYLYQYLTAPYLLNFVYDKSTGGTIKHLNQGVLIQFPVPIPCLEEQQKIADFLSTYDEAISYAKQELDKWKELKKGLLQQVFM